MPSPQSSRPVTREQAVRAGDRSDGEERSKVKDHHAYNGRQDDETVRPDEDHPSSRMQRPSLPSQNGYNAGNDSQRSSDDVTNDIRNVGSCVVEEHRSMLGWNAAQNHALK